jgi:hypothetical protein
MGDVARLSLMKSFPLRFPRYREPMRLIAFVTDSGSITRLLAYLGEPTQAPGIAPAVPPRWWEEDFDPREGTVPRKTEENSPISCTSDLAGARLVSSLRQTDGRCPIDRAPVRLPADAWPCNEWIEPSCRVATGYPSSSPWPVARRSSDKLASTRPGSTGTTSAPQPDVGLRLALWLRYPAYPRRDAAP